MFMEKPCCTAAPHLRYMSHQGTLPQCEHLAPHLKEPTTVLTLEYINLLGRGCLKKNHELWNKLKNGKLFWDVFLGGLRLISFWRHTHFQLQRIRCSSFFGVFGGERPHHEENPNLLHALPAVTDWHHHVGWSIRVPGPSKTLEIRYESYYQTTFLVPNS